MYKRQGFFLAILALKCGHPFAFLLAALVFVVDGSPGYISERNADIGTLVGPGGKSLLATVVKSDTVRGDFSMTALDYLRSKARNVNLGHKDSTRKWDP